MSEDKKKKARKRGLTIGFVLLNVAVIAWTALSEFAGGEDASKFTDIQIKWWMILPAAAAFVIALLAEVYKYYILIRETKSFEVPSGDEAPRRRGKQVSAAVKRRATWKVAFRTVLLGRYYDNVTPAAVGGQPFQIYFMHKNGVKDGYGAVIPLIGMISDQIGFLIIGVLAILIGSLTNAIWSPAIVAVGWIGLLFFAFFPLVILAATFLPKTTEEIMTIGIKFLHKIHVIKDEEKATEKAGASVRQYADGVKTILKTKGLFAKIILLGVTYYAGLMIIPYFVLSAFGAQIGLFASFATTVAVSAAVYFIPTPGNAGAAEGTFYSVFSVLPTSGYVFWAMLFWRFFVYYIWLILGGVMQLKMYAQDKSMMNSWTKGVGQVEDSLSERVRRK